ncbi:MAG: Tfx family DNA-binding protein [Haloferacaceae archaeon]
MVDTDETVLTDRQVEVLALREQGLTQQEVADELGTTDSNVSAVERAAETNVEKARRTLELVRTVRAPARVSVEAGTSFDDLVSRVYDAGDEAGVTVSYCRPELYAHLYGALDGSVSRNRLETAVTVGLTREGEVRVFADEA